MGKTKNNEIIGQINTHLRENSYCIFANYTNLGALKFTLVRKQLKSKDALAKVYKNNLFKIALSNVIKGESVLKDINVNLTGQLIYIFSKEKDIVDISKIVCDLYKEKVFTIKGGILNNSYFSEDQIKDLSTIPSYEVLIVKLLNQFQLPIVHFINVLMGNIRNLLNVLNEIKNKKE